VHTHNFFDNASHEWELASCVYRASSMSTHQTMPLIVTKPLIALNKPHSSKVVAQLYINNYPLGAHKEALLNL